MELYNSIKKGHKVAISKDINGVCREYFWIHEQFNEEEEAIEWCLDKIYRNYFLRLLHNRITEKEQLELREYITERTISSFTDFSNQEPTMKQIYFYVSLCVELGEVIKPIYTNKEMFYRIKELVKCKKEQEDE